MPFAIQHDRDAHRFHTEVDGRLCVLDYTLAGSVMTITHTLVPPEVGGRGIASALMQAAVTAARTEGWTVVPVCSYAQAWMQRHPEPHAPPARGGAQAGVVQAPAAGAERARPRGWRPWRVVKARPRLMLALLMFLAAVAALAGAGLRSGSALLLGFDLATVFYLGILARRFSRATPNHMRREAQLLDTGRWGVLWSGVLLSTVVLAALGNELHAAHGGGLPALGLGVLSVVLSWLFLNVMFALHYAHGYYGNLGDKHSGLAFPDTPQPDYWDFAYFSIVIGMTFQVSDVQITSTYLRRVVLLHSVIAFFFNVFIIAITVNIVAGQGG